MPKTNLEWALEYLAKGLPIFPVKCLTFEKDGKTEKVKKPLVDWKPYQTRLPTEEEVRQWWTSDPTAGIGMATGALSRYTVIDLDTHGSELLDTFNLLDLPIPIVKTPSGGRHCYFLYTPKIGNSAAFVPQHDSRNDGGYVVMPPTLYFDGTPYEWVNTLEDALTCAVPVAAVTAYANRPAVVGGGTVGEKKDWQAILGEETLQGARNQTAASVIGKILRGLDSKDWPTVGWNVLRSWNKTNCVPPDDEAKLRSTFESICKTEARRRLDGAEIGEAILTKEGDAYEVRIRVKEGEAVFHFADIDYDRAELSALVEARVEVTGQKPLVTPPTKIKCFTQTSTSGFTTTLNATFGKDATKWSPVVGIAVRTLQEAVERDIFNKFVPATGALASPATFILPPFIEESSINFFFGQRNSCKTYMAVRWMMSCASGIPFFDCTPTKCNVLFLDYEAEQSTFENRLMRLGQRMEGWDNRYAAENITYHAAEGRPLSVLLPILRQVIIEKGIKLLVIDSCGMATSDAIEESRTAIRFSQDLKKLGVTSLILAHVRKGDTEQKDPFGSSFFANVARTAWNCRGEVGGDNAKLTLSHQKNNNTRKQPDHGYIVSFTENNGPVEIQEVNSSDLVALGEISARTLILRHLADGPKTLEDLYELMPDKKKTAIRRAITRATDDKTVQIKGRGNYALGKGMSQGVSQVTNDVTMDEDEDDIPFGK